MKRIALVADFPLHVIPGLEEHQPQGHFATWLPQLAQAFAAQQEFELHWVFTSRRLNRPEPIRWLNQTFHCLYVPGRMRMLSAYWRDGRAIRRRLDEIQPDLVHAWGSEDNCGLAVALQKRPWLLSIQGILSEYVARAPMHPYVHLQALYERFIFARAREMTVESTWGREVLGRRAPHARVHLVEYGVLESFYELSWTPDATRPTAVFIGTLDKRKGLADAIRAFADPRLSHAELQIIGGGDPRYIESLQQEAGSNVRWLGRKTRQETAAALAKAWCLVLPTRADTSPNVVKEARVLGLPVVTTPDGGQRDYITNGVNGFLVKAGDIAGLTGALSTVLSDLEATRAMGEHHWQEQREFFRPGHTAERFLKLYRELTQEAGGS